MTLSAVEKARRRARQNFRIGLLAIALSVVALYLAFAGLPFHGGYEISAVLPQASQIHANSPVRIAGVNVGKVTKVGRGPGNTAKITMRIDDSGLPIHRDATLKIRPRLFLEGNFFVDLRPGTPSAPDLPDGGTLPITQTAIPVQFDQLLTALDHSTREDLTTILHEYRSALDKGGAAGVNRAFGPSEAAFKGFALVSQESQGLSRHDVSQFIADNERVTRALDARRGQLADLITSFRRTIGAFAAQSGNVAASTREFANLVEEAYPALGEVDRALPPLRRLAATLRPLARRSSRTLALALPLLRQFRGLVSHGELPRLLRDAQPTMEVLAASERPLTGLFGQITPVNRCVTEHALPVLQSTLDDGDLSTGMKVWQESLAVYVALASAAQNFDANGPTTHLLAGAGDESVPTGQVPGVSRLVGEAAYPIVGSRPAPPAARPPWRPEVPCLSQQLPNLDAKMRPAPAARRITPGRPNLAQARRMRAALAALARQEQRKGVPAARTTVLKALNAAAVGR